MHRRNDNFRTHGQIKTPRYVAVLGSQAQCPRSAKAPFLMVERPRHWHGARHGMAKHGMTWQTGKLTGMGASDNKRLRRCGLQRLSDIPSWHNKRFSSRLLQVEARLLHRTGKGAVYTVSRSRPSESHRIRLPHSFRLRRHSLHVNSEEHTLTWQRAFLAFSEENAISRSNMPRSTLLLCATHVIVRANIHEEFAKSCVSSVVPIRKRLDYHSLMYMGAAKTA
ncbi:hypothetical protein EDB89DRAFT_1971316 [Lactarius sanguifluus]|nr:hypothetical protein EDB89DRAFT_1971316 [Lactarius sanguifluus]